jgi:hypothetical protein
MKRRKAERVVIFFLFIVWLTLMVGLGWELFYGAGASLWEK